VLELPPESRSFFGADEVLEAAGRFAVLLVLEGEGRVDGSPATRGSAFAVPAAVESLAVEGELRALRCLAPDPV
jgi:mannose-6-phosphate isomerase class I